MSAIDFDMAMERLPKGNRVRVAVDIRAGREVCAPPL